MSVRNVKIVNRAADCRSEAVGRCCVLFVDKDGGEALCRNDARWAFFLDDSTRIRVCRMHANKGERSGTLRVAGV